MEEIAKSLRQFVTEFALEMDVDSREEKCQEEDIERYNAYMEADDSNWVEESCDRVLTGLLNLMALHVDPVQAVKDKLEATFVRYRARKGGGNYE